MEARLRPKGQLLAASPALGAVAWPYDKARLGCALLPGTAGVGVAGRSTHDLRGVQDCAFLRWRSSNGGKKMDDEKDAGDDDDDVGVSSSPLVPGAVDMLAAASRTAVDVFVMSRALWDEEVDGGGGGGGGGGGSSGGGVRVRHACALALPPGVGAICSLAWRPSSSSSSSSSPSPPLTAVVKAQLLVVTKSCALLFTLDDDLSMVDAPASVPIPVASASTFAAFAGDALALCGGGEFSLHSANLLMSPAAKGGGDGGESTCLCADLASAAPNAHLGVPRSLAHMATMSSATNDIFVCLTDSPVALPFASGKRDRPLNEALHMMRTVRSKKKFTPAVEPAVTAAAATAAAADEDEDGGDATPSRDETSTMDGPDGGKNLESDQVIDLVGGFNSSAGLTRGNPGGTLGALMSIGGRGGGIGEGAILHAANMLNNSSTGSSSITSSCSSSTSSSLSNAAPKRTTPAPCLNIYRLAARDGSAAKSIMRVSVCRVPLINGDIMAVCGHTGLVAVGSGTCGQICIFKPVIPQHKLKMFKKIDLAGLITGFKQENSSAGEKATSAATSAATSGPSATPTLNVRCKGLSFVNAELWVLAGVKTDQGAGFFSAGATSFACELRRFRFAKFVAPPAPAPAPAPVPQSVHMLQAPAQVVTRPSSGSPSTDTDTIVQAIESMRVHMDSRLDRIEGSLLMHSQRLSKIERAIAASK
jgi:hypothetical protein